MLSLNHYFMQHIGRMEIKKAPNFFEAFYLVTQLGLEPRTPSLKGMCSTN